MHGAIAEDARAESNAGAVAEVLAAGLQLGQPLLEHVGLPTDAARDVVDAKRADAAQAMAPHSGSERSR